MKNILVIPLLLFATLVFGQRKKTTDTGKPIKNDNFLVDIHYSSLINAPAGVHFDFGTGASFQLFYDHQFKVKTLSGAIGIGYSNDDYYSNAYLSDFDSINGDYSTFYPFHTIDSTIKRSKYVTNYFDFPAEIRFRSKPNAGGHSWKASIGIRVGLRLGSHTRTETEDGRFQTYNHDNLRKNRIGLTGRFGYGAIGFVGYYSLTTLFEEGKGHELTPWSIGFTISPF